MRRHLRAVAALLALALLTLAPAETAGAATPVTGPSGPGHHRACAAPTGPRAACLAEVVDGPSVHALAAGSLPSGYGPADLAAAYRLPSGTGGEGQVVAIVDAYDLPTAEVDLATYRSRYGLPPCTSSSGCFRKVNQTGGTTPPKAHPGWGQEIALDMDMVSAACPKCSILLVEANSDLLTDLGAAVDTAVRLGARFVSNSYGAAASAWLSSYDTSYYDHPGVAITASSGDTGYGVSFPAASRFVTAVGGTTLTRTASSARGWTETAWGGAGSGCATTEPKPAWQRDWGCSNRTVADVAAVADPKTGVAVYDSTPNGPQSGWQVMGGTSAGAPLIAAGYALAGVPVAGTYPASYPYQHTGALNDVSGGSNGTCGTYLCTAIPGYDGPTGLGTPKGVTAFTPGTSPGPAVSTGHDWDGDGHPDVLARDGAGRLWLYAGNGRGGWLARRQVGAGWNAMTALVAPGDFDGDTHPDLLARDSAGQLWLYPGNGRGGWLARRQVGAGWNALDAIL